MTENSKISPINTVVLSVCVLKNSILWGGGSKKNLNINFGHSLELIFVIIKFMHISLKSNI